MNDRTPFESLDDLASRLSALVPADLKAARDDLSGNFRAVLNAWFERMDLVTREEFDVQRAVLQRTREKVERLEQAVRRLTSDPDPDRGQDPGSG